MSGKPRTRKNSNKREAIIQASTVLFERVGYHRASMQMLADEVGLGKPTLYHYFKSKSQILYSIHQEVISKVIASHEERVSQHLSPDELLRGMAKDMLTFIKEHPGYVRAFFEHVDELDPEDKKDVTTQRDQYMEAAMNVIKAGTKAGVFKKCNPRITTLAFFGMINWTYKWYPSVKSKSVTAMTTELCDLFLQGLDA